MAFPWSILSLTIALDQSVCCNLVCCKILFLSHNYFCCFQLSTPHQWLEGNLPVSARCSVCDDVCGSKRRLQGFRCLWCNMMVSNGQLQRLTFQHTRGCLKKKEKKNLNSSLSFGQAALTHCLPRASSSLVLVNDLFQRIACLDPFSLFK